MNPDEISKAIASRFIAYAIYAIGGSLFIIGWGAAIHSGCVVKLGAVVLVVTGVLGLFYSLFYKAKPT